MRNPLKPIMLSVVVGILCVVMLMKMGSVALHEAADRIEA